MAKPELLPVPLIKELQYQPYDTVLPTAFNEAPTLLEKMNMILQTVNESGRLTNEMIKKWNEVITWVMNDGLKEALIAKLEEWLADGTLEEIIGEVLDDLLALKADITYVDNEIKKLSIDETLTITVGVGQTFTTIQSALNYLSGKRNTYRGKVNLNLVSGFVMKEQVNVKSQDFSYVTINKADAVHVIDTDFLTQTISVNQSPEFTVTPAFACENGTLPNLNVLFKMKSKEGLKKDATGIYLNHSTIHVLPNSGITDSNFIGCCAINGSNVVANYSDFSNSGNREKITVDNYETLRYGDGFRIWGSTLTANYANADRAGDIGFNINMASTANLNHAHSNGTAHHGIMASTASNIAARNAICNDVLDDAVVAYAGSNIDFRDGTCNNAVRGSGIVATRSSHINFEDGVANNCYNGGIYVNRGSSVDAEGAIVTNSTKDNITCANGSMLNFNNGTSLNSGQDNLHCNHGYTVSAFKCRLENAGECNILAYGTGTLSAEDSTILNATRRNVEATTGASVSVRDATVLGSKDGSDCSVYNGGTIQAHNISTGTTFNRELNTLTSNGIIFKV